MPTNARTKRRPQMLRETVASRLLIGITMKGIIVAPAAILAIGPAGVLTGRLRVVALGLPAGAS